MLSGIKKAVETWVKQHQQQQQQQQLPCLRTPLDWLSQQSLRHYYQQHASSLDTLLMYGGLLIKMVSKRPLGYGKRATIIKTEQKFVKIGRIFYPSKMKKVPVLIISLLFFFSYQL